LGWRLLLHKQLLLMLSPCLASLQQLPLRLQQQQLMQHLKGPEGQELCWQHSQPAVLRLLLPLLGRETLGASLLLLPQRLRLQRLMYPWLLS
jgi:hypothetical protein